MNPWLKIPLNDYEAHMSEPKVGQLQLLNNFFKNVINKYKQNSLCVLGCTNGNGFEHLINDDNRKIFGFDINYNYLNECSAKYKNVLSSLNLVCADIDNLEIKENSFDLIHAALIFEYVNVEKTINNISKWLKGNGILSVVLQIPSDKSSPVSDTGYESLKSLNSILQLVNLSEFNIYIDRNKLIMIESYFNEMPNGKQFFVGIYRKQY